MPLQVPDPRIAANTGGGGGGATGMFGTLGSLMQIKEQQMVLRARQRQEEDDAATEAALQQHERPDDAIDSLWKQGRSDAAENLAKSVYTDRQYKAKAYADQLTTNSKRLEQASQIMHGVNDERSFQLAKPAIGALLEPVFGQGVYDQIGTNYDPERKKALVDWGTDRVQQMNADRQAALDMDRAWEIGKIKDPKTGAWSFNGQKIQDAYRGSLARRLSVTSNAEQWDYYRKLAHDQGVPDEIIKEFGTWTTDAPERAKKLGMSFAEETMADYRDRTAETAAEREARLSAGGGGVFSRNQLRLIDQRKQDAYEDVEDWVRKQHDTDVRKTKPNWEKGPDGKPIKPKFSLDNLTDESKAEYIRQRIQAENNDREIRGMGSLEEAGRAAAESGDIEGYEKVRGVYDDLTKGLLGQTFDKLVPPPKGARAPGTPPPPTGARSRGVAPSPDRRKTTVSIQEQLKTERDPRKRMELYRQLGDMFGIDLFPAR